MRTALDSITSSVPNTQILQIENKVPTFALIDQTEILNDAPSMTLCANKSVLSITGEQRLKFLQGQATCDTTEINEQQARFGAFCNLKGRVIANFLAYDDAQSTHLIMSEDLVAPLIAHLTKFAVFFRVTLTENEDTVVLGEQTGSNDLSFMSVTSQDTSLTINVADNRRLHVTTADNAIKLLTNADQLSNESSWNIKDIQNRIAWTNAQTSEEFLPQLLGLEEIKGLSFSKGCYTGQEIIARMKYRGQLKRELQQVQIITENAAPLSEGTKIDAPEKKNVGQIITALASANTYTALITLENDYKDTEDFIINGAPVTLVIN